MTVNSNCFLLFLGLLFVIANGEDERQTYFADSVPCSCPYSCLTTNECAGRHADNGIEEVLFRCDAKGKVCCPPVRKSRGSVTTDIERSQLNEYSYNADCPDNNRNFNRTDINSGAGSTTYTEPKLEEQEYFQAPGELNLNFGSSDDEPNIYNKTRKPVATQIVSTTTRRTFTTELTYEGGSHINVVNSNKKTNINESRKPVGTQTIRTTTRQTVTIQQTHGGGNSNLNNINTNKQSNINESRRPVGTQIISGTTHGEGNSNVNNINNNKQFNINESRRPGGTQKLSITTRRPFVQETYTQSPTTSLPPQKRPLGLPNSKIVLSSHRNFNLLPKGAKCGVNNLANRIVEGDEVSLGEYPWMALTGIRDNYGNLRWNCGGTLINGRYVLTAAHCLTVNNRTVEYVRLGEHNLTNETDCAAGICLDKPEDVPIAEIIPHENWNTTTIKNDIALIRLSRNPLGIGNSNIFPICLPFDKLNLTATTNYVVAGWGKTDWTNDQGSDILRKASMSGISREECNICKGSNKQQYCPITDNQLCVQGYKSVDVCKGDSGGPLMVSHINVFQVGITSFKASEYCGAENLPSIFTRVESYLPWILDNIRQ